MTGLFSWLSELIQWFAAWIPRLMILKATHGGVKYVHGKKVKELLPGLHIYWPAVTEIETIHINRVVLDLANQNLLTKDGREVAVSGVVVYHVTNVITYLTENYDANSSMHTVALKAVRRVVVNSELCELQASAEKFDRELCREVRRSLKKFGVTVEDAGLTDFSTSRVYSVVGATHQHTILAQ